MRLPYQMPSVTRWAACGALVIETAGVMGDAVDKSKVRDLLDAIGPIIWGVAPKTGGALRRDTTSSPAISLPPL